MALEVKNLPANAGDIRDARSIPGSGISPGGENGNPLQCSCLENSKDGVAWQAIWVIVTRILRWPRSVLFHRCSTLLFTGHIVKNTEKV